MYFFSHVLIVNITLIFFREREEMKEGRRRKGKKGEREGGERER